MLAVSLEKTGMRVFHGIAGLDCSCCLVRSAGQHDQAVLLLNHKAIRVWSGPSESAKEPSEVTLVAET